MKKLKLIIVFILWVICLAAQDVIIKRNGDEIKAKVTNLSATEVKYKVATNLGGPDYTLATTDVFMIKYKNGKKDVFDNGVVKTYTANATKTKQPEPAPVICKRTINDVYTTNKIYFYGYDYAHMKFVEDKRENDGGRIYRTITKWQNIVNEHHDQKFMQRTLKIDTVVMLTHYGFNASKLADSTKIMSNKQEFLQKDSVQKWLKQYNFKEQDGIGYLIFVDCFYKPQKNSALTFVFFDIASKQILLYDKLDKDEADGYGLPHYWAQSVSVTVARFNGDKVKQPRKKFNK